MKLIQVNDIVVEVTKKNIKNIHLKICPPEGKVIMSVPKKMIDLDITKFISSKMDWILAHREKYLTSQQTTLSYVTGERIFLWGKQYELVVKTAKANKLSIVENTLILYVKENSTPLDREFVLNEYYRYLLKADVPTYIRKWESIIGVKIRDWGVKNMKTRWGTCNVKDKRIWVNLQLAKKDHKCLEYIIVHELVHLLEANHSQKFYSYMDQFLPNWKEIRDELNKIY